MKNTYLKWGKIRAGLYELRVSRGYPRTERVGTVSVVGRYRNLWKAMWFDELVGHFPKMKEAKQAVERRQAKVGK